MSPLKQAAIAIIASAAFTQATLASNLNFLEYSPISYFTAKDSALMQANSDYALDHTKDGQKSSWNNPQTGAWGYAIPANTTRTNGTTCRDLTIYNNAHKTPGQATYHFCKINGQWKAS
jgi:surface antigen